MFLLLYLMISNALFAMLIFQGDIISDRQFFQALIWCYVWPIEMWIVGNKADFVNSLDKYIDYVTDWNEKFRSLMYFALYNVGQESTD